MSTEKTIAADLKIKSKGKSLTENATILNSNS